MGCLWSTHGVVWWVAQGEKDSVTQPKYNFRFQISHPLDNPKKKKGTMPVHIWTCVIPRKGSTSTHAHT
jgi:hypothetical protein